ncbi:GntR family transcriptional regulator [Pseudovibrio sp. Tun.PSC04-5.I4]|uniref:GntR family transcriptional regulator n=1 Tax=Pseudovibrio sp. Tun.PSC04-5.I4 TaxID=1798213 RepID=UPI00088BB4CE|nr:GntR family transcriptional regulator [Pseudovibrio sp. Tun.PSC04-5.I4]SDR25545.1 DNA-binding transcriptional regulator, GntR family [Pseudovibrio sp. Tun.PSC04-5.I4]
MLHSTKDRSIISRFGISPFATSSSRKSDAVYHYLKERIIVGMLRPGAAIAEQQVASACDCAQGTVREALLRLQQSGLVVRHDYKGTRVAGVQRAEVLEMAKIRTQLEEQAGRLVASKIHPETRDLLFEILDAMCQTAMDNETYLCSAYDHMFHTTIFNLSELRGLQPILKRCAMHMYRVTLSHRGIPLNPEEVYQQHVVIIEAHCKGSPDEAAHAARQHVEFLIDTWMSEQTFLAFAVPESK